MTGARLTHAIDRHGLDLPEAGTILVAGARAGEDLSDLPRARTLIVQPLRHDHDALAAAGWTVRPDWPEGRVAATIVCLPRARDAAQDRIARAAALSDGPVVVDGARTDGVESLWRDLRARGLALMPADGAVSKAHGRLFWFHGPDARLADWTATPRTLPGGFVTRAGVFSADGPDPASESLAAALPASLPPRVADLGAGWGYLAAAILQRDGVRELDLVEADHDALACARASITDPRARFHWADARNWRPSRPLDAVVMNPPFHDGRAADPALGAAFIAAAARMLAPQGVLWMVANRHLPYDAALAAAFRDHAEIGGDGRFRLIRASHPLSAKATAGADARSVRRRPARA